MISIHKHRLYTGDFSGCEQSTSSLNTQTFPTRNQTKPEASTMFLKFVYWTISSFSTISSLWWCMYMTIPRYMFMRNAEIRDHQFHLSWFSCEQIFASLQYIGNITKAATNWGMVRMISAFSVILYQKKSVDQLNKTKQSELSSYEFNWKAFVISFKIRKTRRRRIGQIN